MRQIIITVSILLIVFYSGLSIMKVNERMTRKDELDRAVASAVQQTVKCSRPSGSDILHSDEEMMEMFMDNFFLNINSAGKVEILFMGVNYEMGMLDVEVIETYTEVTGEKEKISVRKIAIFS